MGEADRQRQRTRRTAHEPQKATFLCVVTTHSPAPSLFLRGLLLLGRSIILENMPVVHSKGRGMIRLVIVAVAASLSLSAVAVSATPGPGNASVEPTHTLATRTSASVDSIAQEDLQRRRESERELKILRKRVADEPGPPCEGFGTACSYVTSEFGATVDGFCGPTGQCAQNGAPCNIDDNCLNFCGTDGVCGGLGATCSSQTEPQDSLNAFTCYGPRYVCSTDEFGGVCLLIPSMAGRARRRNNVELSARGTLDLQGQGQGRVLSSRASKAEIMAHLQAHAKRDSQWETQVKAAQAIVAAEGDEELDL